MLVAYYYVSGVSMEILKFLLTLLNNGDLQNNLSSLLTLFNKGSLDLKSLLSNLNLETLAPLLKDFFNQKPHPTQTVERGFGLNPIAKIADKDIVYTLNKYFYSG